MEPEVSLVPSKVSLTLGFSDCKRYLKRGSLKLGKGVWGECDFMASWRVSSSAASLTASGELITLAYIYKLNNNKLLLIINLIY